MDVINWAIYIAIAILVISAAVAILAVFGSWLKPRVILLYNGQTKVKGSIPCCPPGLGCNEPNKKDRRCMRHDVHSIATVDELQNLDKAWSTYFKSHSKKDHQHYLNTLSSIYARKLNAAADLINKRALNQLPLSESGEVLER